MSDADNNLVLLKVYLPQELLTFVQEQAARADRTVGGQVRFWVAEKHRTYRPLPSMPANFEVPGVRNTEKGVAEAKSRIGKMQREQEAIREKKRKFGTTASEDARH